MAPRPLSVAWQDALYGDHGFYRRPRGPAGHFATSAQGVPGVSHLYVESLLAMADRLGATHLVDLGAGRGELLTSLHAQAPRLRLTGVDVVDRPADLPPGIDWVLSPGGDGLPALPVGADTLVVANEWLDVVPCTVAEWDGDRWRVVHEDNSLGDEPSDDERAWQQRWWPVADPIPGDRVEIGLTRDRAFADLRANGAAVVAIDYGHFRDDRPDSGTLMGYRHGVGVQPLFDGSTDVTAHVAMDSLGADELITQREAFSRLGIRADQPSLDLASTDPAGYLAGLARRTALAAARDPAGLGGFWWALSCPLDAP
ncbi:SAM-dependent methyltransferase [Branchiibius sp. NY16-3462-2]|uniref:SAM-dependent methyltransferase n=1 Tax=Branchiibius sp. NY16-3462-2 TaxID=1807500 RepID=UPI000798A3AB|nr:SAM-dependent methyltransferase [Branchiibius sp. NY16-3462-2]KYH46266.1 hypothetical protein AZH51_11675 [Branchiibius sp. NY16-3462-2]